MNSLVAVGSTATATITSADTSYIPAHGSKPHKLLGALLAGIEVDVAYAYLEMNIPAVQARCAELRKIGWPIRTHKRRHPKLAGEEVTTYLIDAQFRRWFAANPDKHPREYPVQEGRGRFATEVR